MRFKSPSNQLPGFSIALQCEALVSSLGKILSFTRSDGFEAYFTPQKTHYAYWLNLAEWGWTPGLVDVH
jgi:hypothetical protein